MRGKRFLLLVGIFLALAMLMSLSQDPPGIISLDRENYSVSEVVTIRLNFSDFNRTKLEISNSERKYNYPEPKALVRFVPRIPGYHTVLFFRDDILLDNTQFIVYPYDGNIQEDAGDESQAEAPPQVPPVSQKAGEVSISTDKQQYSLSETVYITITGADDLSKYSMELKTDGKDYRFFSLEKEVRFLPSLPGQYTVFLRQGGKGISEGSFSVVTELPVPEQQEQAEQNMTDSQGASSRLFIKGISLQILDRRNNPARYRVVSSTIGQDIKMESSFFGSSNQRVVLEIDGSPIRKIDFVNPVFRHAGKHCAQ